MLIRKLRRKIDFFSYNPEQSIWNKMEKSSETGQGQKSLVSIFAWFLTAMAKI